MIMFKEEARNTVQKVREARNLVVPYLQNLALERGFARGRTDYTRFIVVGRSRVGSNFLRGLLNSHSQIVVYGELFQNTNAIGWALPGYGQSERDLTLFRRNPVRFLETKVFHPFPKETCAVGFKIFYYHAQQEAWKPVWEWLHGQSQLKVIHLKRHNLLKTHLSRQRAALTDVWVNVANSKEQAQPLTLDYEACLADFVQTRAWEAEYDTFFHDHPKIEVIYEELARDYIAEMRRVQRFLGVQDEVLVPETFKQSSAPLSEAILNYAELKERFAGTEWEAFFTA